MARVGHGHGVTTTFALMLVGATVATLVSADLLWRFVEHPALQRRLPWRQAEFGRTAAARLALLLGCGGRPLRFGGVAERHAHRRRMPGVSRRYHSASSAAWQPEPAAVIAWR